VHGPADLAGCLGQLVRSEDEQGHEQDDEELGSTDVEHGVSLSAADPGSWSRRVLPTTEGVATDRQRGRPLTGRGQLGPDVLDVPLDLEERVQTGSQLGERVSRLPGGSGDRDGTDREEEKGQDPERAHGELIGS
jgi:hypothetical protein